MNTFRRFQPGDQVRANGYQGVIVREYDPPRIEATRVVGGTYEVRLPGGVACLGAGEIEMLDGSSHKAAIRSLARLTTLPSTARDDDEAYTINHLVVLARDFTMKTFGLKEALRAEIARAQDRIDRLTKEGDAGCRLEEAEEHLTAVEVAFFHLDQGHLLNAADRRVVDEIGIYNEY